LSRELRQHNVFSSGLENFTWISLTSTSVQEAAQTVASGFSPLLAIETSWTTGFSGTTTSRTTGFTGTARKKLLLSSGLLQA